MSGKLHDPARVERRRAEVEKILDTLPRPLVAWGVIVHDNDGEELRISTGSKDKLLVLLARLVTTQTDPSWINYLLETYRQIQERHDSVTPVFTVRVALGTETECTLEWVGPTMSFAVDAVLNPAALPS